MITKIYGLPNGRIMTADVDEKNHMATINEHVLYDLVKAVNMTDEDKRSDMFTMLDMIRGELGRSRWTDDTRTEKNALASGLDKAIKIIDKYMEKVEPQESED